MIAQAQQLIDVSPYDTRAWIALGLAQFQQREFAAALEALTQATRLAPADPVAHFGLGRVYQACEYLPRAVRCYDRARRLDLHYAPARDALAKLLSQQESQELLTVERACALLEKHQYKELVQLGRAAVAPLAAIHTRLKSGDVLKTPVIAVLARIGAPAVDALCQQAWLTDRTGLDRDVLQALAFVGGQQANALLQSAYQELQGRNATDSAIQQVVAALVQLGEPVALALVVAELGSTGRDRRFNCLAGIDAAFQFLDDSVPVALTCPRLAETVFRATLADADAEIRALSAKVLGRLGHALAAGALAQMLRDAVLEVRLAAADALAELAERHLPAAVEGAPAASIRKRGGLFDTTGWTADEGAIDALMAALAGPAELRRRAGRALGWLGNLALPDLSATASLDDARLRFGLAWASQSMHASGRDTLQAAGARLAPLQTRTWKIGVMYPTVFPGAVRVTLTGPSVEEELGQRCVHIRDNGVRVVTALQPVAGGFFLQGVDRDDVQSGDVVEAIMPAAPKDRVDETGKLPALPPPQETRLVCQACFERIGTGAPGALL